MYAQPTNFIQPIAKKKIHMSNTKIEMAAKTARRSAIASPVAATHSHSPAKTAMPLAWHIPAPFPFTVGYPSFQPHLRPHLRQKRQHPVYAPYHPYKIEIAAKTAKRSLPRPHLRPLHPCYTPPIPPHHSPRKRLPGSGHRPRFQLPAPHSLATFPLDLRCATY